MYELLLDCKIRDWVLLPIFFANLFVGLGRHFASALVVKSATTISPRPDELKVKQQQNIVKHAMRFRVNCSILTPTQFKMRRALFNSPTLGILRVDVGDSDAPIPNPTRDFSKMEAGIKQALIQKGPELGMMGLVSSFFSGFIICRGMWYFYRQLWC